MAGDWIKFEHATLDKPEVLQMAEMLNTTADDVVGKLLRVWIWFDVQSRDGNAGSVSGNALKRFIDRLVALQDFASCMEKVGWLTDSGVPNFDRHNGESAKKRALTKKRLKRFRNAVSNANETPNALPEKRREEKIKTTTAFELPDWVPTEAWEAFAEMRARIKAPLTDRGKALLVRDLEKLRGEGYDPRVVLELSTANSWRGVFPPRAAAKTYALPAYK